METYWCCKKNSIIDNYINEDFNPALVPCIKDKCPRWKEWEGRGDYTGRFSRYYQDKNLEN